jgi:hypothetical protein
MVCLTAFTQSINYTTVLELTISIGPEVAHGLVLRDANLTVFVCDTQGRKASWRHLAGRGKLCR